MLKTERKLLRKNEKKEKEEEGNKVKEGSETGGGGGLGVKKNQRHPARPLLASTPSRPITVSRVTFNGLRKPL